MEHYSVVLAADVPDPAEVEALVKRVGSVVDGVKIGMSTVLQAGVGFLKKVRDAVFPRPVLLDIKIADIGYAGSTGWEGTNAKIMRCLGDSGATHVTVHGFPGFVSVAEAVAVAHEVGISVLLLPIMSHQGADLFFSRPLDGSELASRCREIEMEGQVLNVSRCSSVTDGIVILGEALHTDGYIGPSTNPTVLKRMRELTSQPIWCPGFGRQDKMGRDLAQQLSDWAHSLGPQSAAIVGSLIFTAPDPLSAAKQVIETRNKVVESMR
jgi:orotidine 5'-phosphate decarboxylase subfamily 1